MYVRLPVKIRIPVSEIKTAVTVSGIRESLFKGENMKGFKYRMGLRIFNLGIKLKIHWIIRLGDRIKRSGMGEYV